MSSYSNFGAESWVPIVDAIDSRSIMSFVRQVLPQTIAADIVGVQPMSEPTGLIFAVKPKYSSHMTAQQAALEEAMKNLEALKLQTPTIIDHGTYSIGENIDEDLRH